MADSTSRLKVLIVVLGSGGDVFPFIAIGKRLRAEGHSVLLATNPYFEDAVRNAGIEFAAQGTVEEARETIENPELWQRGKGFRLVFQRALETLPATYNFIRERYVPGQTVVVANVLAFGARVANEKLGAPLATVHLQPIALRSLNEQPGVVVPEGFRPVLRPLRRVLTAALDRWLLDPMVVPQLNGFRAQLELAPVRRVFQQWVHSPQLVLGMFPDWFARPQPDWPPNTHLTGFPLFDQTESAGFDDELTRFLEEGAPPIVFTLGTAMVFARRFFEVSAEACRILGRRGLLLTRFPEQLPAKLPANVRHVSFAPFSELLPRAAALVHHGGIGTLSQALAAGIPQLVVPFNFDQPDNAARIRHLGVGYSIRPRRYEPRGVARRLDDLLNSAEVNARARRVAANLAGRNPIGEACRLIEALALSAQTQSARLN